MNPKHTTTKILLCFFCLVLCVLFLIFFIIKPTAFSQSFIFLLDGICILLILFFLYKIYRLSHRHSTFQKGILSPRDLDNMDGIDFEELTCDILIANGFELAENTQASVDFGVDVLARKDGITYAIQCKRYTEPVGIDAVQQVYAGRAYYECHAAVVFTNQYFTDSAKKLADKIGVVLWDREMLEQLL